VRPRRTARSSTAFHRLNAERAGAAGFSKTGELRVNEVRTMRTTYFRTLVQERRWTYEGLCIQWKRAREELARKDADPRLASVALSRRTFDRWMKGFPMKLSSPAGDSL
jgi:hypothetical protein